MKKKKKSLQLYVIRRAMNRRQTDIFPENNFEEPLEEP